MMNYIGIVLFAILLPFCIWRVYIISYRIGYRKGAERILAEWKKYMINMEDVNDDKHQGSL